MLKLRVNIALPVICIPDHFSDPWLTLPIPVQTDLLTVQFNAMPNQISSCPGRKTRLGLFTLLLAIFILNANTLLGQKKNNSIARPILSSYTTTDNREAIKEKPPKALSNRAVTVLRGGENPNLPFLSMEPYSGKLVINLPLDWQKKQVLCQIIDSNEQVVWFKKENASGPAIHLDTKFLSPGNYSIQTKCGSLVVVEYLIHQGQD